MDSYSTLRNGGNYNHRKDQECDDDATFPAKKVHNLSSSCRTLSFSSSSSSLSSSSTDNDYSSPLNNPARPFRSFSGIPFSWEKLPGIPKNDLIHNHKKKQEHNNNDLLPLPPPASNANKKESFTIRRDPFIAALVNCSRDDQQSNNARRSVIDRFGFVNLYTNSSCKTNCTVSESMIYVPKSRTRSSYRLINRPSQ
ncbi:hypothetical protein ACFE04_004438 [Oxalis oulophora]